MSRGEKIELIKQVLAEEMDRPSVDCTPIHQFLDVLGRNTSASWRHMFITTNWDYLLQREILALRLKAVPPWLANSHVYHLNGTVEKLLDNTRRSPFLLEEDQSSERCFTPEANVAYNFMIVHRMFVVVGMSFECETDRFLLKGLSRVEDDMPIGDSVWFVVNPDQRTLDRSCSAIQKALPRAEVKGLCKTFSDWIGEGMSELQQCGVITLPKPAQK